MATRFEIWKVMVPQPGIKCILKKHIYYDKIIFYKVDCVNAAVTITLGLGVQSPFASNSLCELDLNDPYARDAHNKRELLKFNNPDFNPAITQPYDSPWYPELKRSTSPLRLLPIKYITYGNGKTLHKTAVSHHSAEAQWRGRIGNG